MTIFKQPEANNLTVLDRKVEGEFRLYEFPGIPHPRGELTKHNDPVFGGQHIRNVEFLGYNLLTKFTIKVRYASTTLLAPDSWDDVDVARHVPIDILADQLGNMLRRITGCVSAEELLNRRLRGVGHSVLIMLRRIGKAMLATRQGQRPVRVLQCSPLGNGDGHPVGRIMYTPTLR